MHDLLLVRRVIAEFAFPFFHAGVLQRDFHVGGRSPRAVRADQGLAVIVQSLVGFLANRALRRQRVRAFAHSRDRVPRARFADVGALHFLHEVSVALKGRKALAQIFDGFDGALLLFALVGTGGRIVAAGKQAQEGGARGDFCKGNLFHVLSF